MPDARMVLGFVFIVGYYATLWIMGFHLIPDNNIPLIKDAMLQLGPPVGIIIGAIFRTDRTDEKRADNTAKAFDAITASAQASGTAPDVKLQPGQTAQAQPSATDDAGGSPTNG